MLKICVLLVLVLVLEMVLQSDALAKSRKRVKPKRMRAGDMVNQLVSLQKNVSSLWTEMNDRESSRVMVHVHGLGDDPAETHEGKGGTHVHIHMHLDDHHDDHDCHDDHGHEDHHDDDDNYSDHGHGDHHDDHGHGDHHGGNESGGHGHHGHGHGMRGCGMMKMKKMKMMHQHMHFPSRDTYVYGHCEMAMNPTLTNSQHKINGAIHFRQKMHQPLEILLHMKGFFVPRSAHSDHAAIHTHGFHVHQYADLSNGCQSFGGHFNPDGVDHAAKDAQVRHAGDWGNIACDERGEVHSNMTDNNTSLVGPHSIMGRGIVIHEHGDDLGLGGVSASLKTGNAGGRLACCVVAWAGEHDWDMLLKHQH